MCVIHGGVALCECPHSHVLVGEQCMPIAGKTAFDTYPGGSE